MQEGLSERLEAGKQIYFEGRHLEALGLLETLASKLEIQAELADCHMFIGMSHHALGDESAARRSFESAVRNYPDLVPQQDLFPPDAFESFVGVREGLVGRIEVRTSPPGARITIAGRGVGTTPYVGNALVGDHRVQVQLEDYHRYDSSVTVRAAETTTVEVTMRMTPAALKRARDEAEGRSGNRTGSKKVVYGLLGGAVAGGALVFATATGSSREVGVPVTRTFTNVAPPFQPAGPYIADVGSNGTLTATITWENPQAALFAEVRLIKAVHTVLLQVSPINDTETRLSIPVEAGNIYHVYFSNVSQTVTNFTLVLNFPG